MRIKIRYTLNVATEASFIQFMRPMLWGVLFLAASVAMNPLQAQDRIIKADSTVILARVLEIGPQEVQYKKFEAPDGPTFVISRKEIVRIEYANGVRQLLMAVSPSEPWMVLQSNEAPPKAIYSKYDNTDLVLMGTGDSIRCRIDLVGTTSISYHIELFGRDPKKKVPLMEVKKYFYKNQWFYANGTNATYNEARTLVLKEKFFDAVAAYSRLIKRDSTNPTLMAEDAYALALAGLYDAALMRLETAWKFEANSPDVNYFTAQVYLLMGYDDLALAFWKMNQKYHVPDWILAYAPTLLGKYKKARMDMSRVDKQSLLLDFDRANELASENLNIQSLGLFHRVINYFPNEYLPYFGYSLTLESAGAYDQSLKAAERALSLLGNSTEDLGRRQVIQERIDALQKRINGLPSYFMPGLYNVEQSTEMAGHLMAYIGGSAMPGYFSFNGRIGYFMASKISTSLDLGLTRSNEMTYFSTGFSTYFRTGKFVTGIGFNLIGGEDILDFRMKGALGLSLMNKKRTSSTDIMLDIFPGIGEGKSTQFTFTVGQCFYIGRRK